MRKCSPIVVVVLALVAGPSTLGDDIEGYLVGEMAQLELLETPVPFGAHEISYLDGSIHTLAEKTGTVLLVNLWAKWCIPCRDEMLDFATLQRELGDDRFEVVTLPMKKRTAKSSHKILKNWNAGNLTPYGNDPKELASVLYHAGLFTETTIQFVYPTTYVVNKRGEIVAIREGFLHWDTPEARALITALKEQEF